MKRPVRYCIAAALLALPPALVATVARAQEVDPEALAEAEALNAEASAALDANDFATACPKLERVVHLVPQGIGAKLTLAECYEGAGKLASAWRAYTTVEETARQARQPEREKLARRKVQALRPKLSELTIVVPDAVRSLPGLEIRRGLSQVAPAEWGVTVPVDAEPQAVVVTAAGKRRWEKTVDVAHDGTKVTVEVGPLEDEPPAAPTAPIVTPRPATPPPPPPVASAQETGTAWGAQRIAGVVVGGAGLVALGLGAGFGASAIAKKNESNAGGHCHDGNFCDDVGYALREEGYTAGTISTVLFIGGGVAVAGGAVLFLTAPRAGGTGATEVAVGPRGVLLRGRW